MARGLFSLGRGAAGLVIVTAALGACAAPGPPVARTTVDRVPGESVVMARVQIPGAISGLSGAAGADAVRVTIQTEGSDTVRPRPLTPAGYLLATLPPGRYRLASWESRAQRATHFGPLDLLFEVPQADRLYYLGTVEFDPQTAERYRLQVSDQIDEAMRYLAAEHPRLAGPYEPRLLAPSPAGTPAR